MTAIEDIIAFHEKFGLAYNGKPRALPLDVAEFRHKFAKEEADEFLKFSFRAAGAVSEGDQSDYTYSLEHILDALVDQMYVLLGTIYLSGMIDIFPEAWDRVHEKNMQKVRAEHAGQSKRGSAHDVIKPEGWTPPSHIDLVEDNDRT